MFSIISPISGALVAVAGLYVLRGCRDDTDSSIAPVGSWVCSCWILLTGFLLVIGWADGEFAEKNTLPTGLYIADTIGTAAILIFPSLSLRWNLRNVTGLAIFGLAAGYASCLAWMFR